MNQVSDSVSFLYYSLHSRRRCVTITPFTTLAFIIVLFIIPHATRGMYQSVVASLNELAARAIFVKAIDHIVKILPRGTKQRRYRHVSDPDLCARSSHETH